MDKRDFVNFELAKLLKDKQYDVPCYGYYTLEGTYKIKIIADNFNRLNAYSKPALYDVQKWLREKYKIHIIIETDFSNMYSFKCVRSKDDEIKIELDRLNKSNNEIFKYNLYTEALSEGIKEALKLI